MSERRMHRSGCRNAVWGAALLYAAQAAAEALPDPTRPPVAEIEQAVATQPAPEVVWQLSMTRVASGRRMAILNGQRVGIGDRVADARVVAIRPGEVVLERDGRRVSVRLSSAPVKSRTTGH